MINQDKWINSLPKKDCKSNYETDQLDPNRWVNTISKKSKYDSIKKYSLASAVFFVCLLLVSAVKNETRNLQKEIYNLKSSIDSLHYNLDKAILDYEVITSPENISQLAKDYLDIDYVSYKKSQIKNLNGNKTIVKSKDKIQNNNLTSHLKLEVVKKIRRTKTELKKLQELYSNTDSIPKEIKDQVVKKMEKKKIEIKKLYSHPTDIIYSKKAQRWAAIQVVKTFLGIPVIPGK